MRPARESPGGRAALAHLTALSAFAIAQPLFDVLRRDPELFVARRSQPGDLIGLTLLLLAAPPLAGAAVLVIAGRASPAVRRVLLTVSVGLLAGMVAAPPLSRLTPLPAAAVAAVALLVAAGAGYLYSRRRWVSGFLALASLAAPAFGLLFLLTAPVSKFVLPPRSVPPASTLGAGPPIVMVIFDALPSAAITDESGRVNGKRFPNLAALSERSHWFPNTVVNSNGTTQSVPAILTGMKPDEERLVPNAADHPSNLFTLLHPTYRMNVSEFYTDLCPDDVCGPEGRIAYSGRLKSLARVSALIYPRVLFPQLFVDESAAATDPFDEFLRVELADARHSAAGDRLGQFRGFERSISPGGSKLHFLHVFLPHSPYDYLPSGKTYPNPGLPGIENRVWVNEWLAFQGQQRLLLQLGLVDRLVGELTRRLESLRMFDESLIVITADHGVSEIDGEPARGLTEGNSGFIAVVPLVIKEPGQSRGVTHRGVARSTDILPAMASAAGLTLPGTQEGRKPSRLLEAHGSAGPYTVFRITEDGLDPFDVADPARRRREAVRLVNRRFGAGGRQPDLFSFGPHADVTGRRIDDLGPLPAAGVEVDRVLPAGRGIDAFVQGVFAVTSRASLPDYVALGLGGVIATVVPVFEYRQVLQFSAMIPESLVRYGRRIDLVGITGPGDSRQFSRLTWNAP